MNRHEIFAALEAIAFHIHRHTPKGLISGDELTKVLTRHMAEARARDENPEQPSPELRDQVSRFRTMLSADVGMLAEHGQNLFGFTHLTFQEYFTARYLTRDPATTARHLLQRLDDARWREPILMALGYVSLKHPDRLSGLMEALLSQDGELGDLMPRGALLVAAALPDMPQASEEVIRQLVERLLRAYSDRTGLARFEPLRERIEAAFNEVRRSGWERTAEEVLRHALARPQDAPAAAVLVRRLEWFSPRLLQALQDAWHGDSAEWGWPIDAALRAAVTPAEGESPRSVPGMRLQFRRALEHNPALAERVVREPDWLRLALALYGGLGDYETPEGLRRYHEMAAYLQLPNAAREPFTLYYGEIWGEDNPVYNMAVFLDTKGGGLMRGAKKTPTLRPSAIYRDSRLTGFLMSALEADRPAGDLVPELRRLQATSLEAGERTEAALALLALGENAPRELACAIKATDSSDGATSLSRRLSQLAAALRDPVARAAPALLEGLKVLAAELPASRWVDVVSATLATAQANGALPINTDDLRAVCDQTQQPRLVAEVLAYMFSGFGDDGVHNAKVLVDTVKLAPELLVKALVCVSTARQLAWPVCHFGWTVEQLPPRSIEPNDIPLTALTALENAHNDVGFIREWALGLMRPIVERNPALKPEVLAVNLGNIGGRSERAAVWSAYEPDLATHPDPRQEVLRLARIVADPYYRSRALLRLLAHFSYERAEIVAEAQRAARGITNPHHNAQILERLIPWLPAGDRPAALNKALLNAEAIEDRDDCARGLARLAFLFPAERRAGLLERALDVAGEIGDEGRHADTLLALRPALASVARLREQGEAATERIGDPWFRAKARDERGLMLLQAHRRLAQVAPGAVQVWAPVALAALVGDALWRLDLVQTVEDLWAALAADPSPERVAALCERGEAEYLVFSSTAAHILDSLRAAGRWQLVEPLCPFLRRAEPEVLPILEGWLRDTHGGRADFAALLLAEANGIGAETVPGLVRLLRSENDLPRCRAATVIHGSEVKPGEGTLPVSGVGARTVETLAAASCRHSTDAPGVSTRIAWMRHDLLHDSPDAIVAWATAVKERHSNSAAAEWILSGIELITKPAWAVFLRELQVNAPSLQAALIGSVARLIHLDKIPGGKMDLALADALAAVDRQPLHNQLVLTAEPEHLIEITIRALQEVAGSGGKPEQLIDDLLSKEYSTSLAAILDLPHEEMIEALDCLAGLNYYIRSNWLEEARRCGEAVKGKPEVLHVLVRWLGSSLRTGVTDSLSFRIRDHLLLVTAGAAVASPTVFTSDPASAELEPLLVEALQYHNGYPGRQAAAILLGCLRRLTRPIAEALQVAMVDVSQVQQGALDAVSRFLRVDDDSLDFLFASLGHESTVTAYTAARLLSTLGRSDGVKAEQRRRILASLAAAIRDPRSRRKVQFHYVDARIPNLPRLEHAFYQALMRVAGMD